MGLCDKRHFLLTICILQILTTSERQVFDFLGYMWVPILVNFFNIIFVILGFFGAFQYRPKYIITYCVWNVVWLTWNAFLICFYLGIGGLDKNSDLLNFGTGSFSWWLINGPGCKELSNNTLSDQPDVYRPIRPDRVVDCFLEYEVIEVIHSSIQCFLAVLSIIGGICLSRVFLEEDDSFDFVGGGDFGTAGHTPLHPMYVSYSALPAAYGNKSGAASDSYYYPTNTTTTAGSASSTLNSGPPTHEQSRRMPPPAALGSLAVSNRVRAAAVLRNQIEQQQQQQHQQHQPRHYLPESPASFSRRPVALAADRPSVNTTITTTSTVLECSNYSNPIDELRPQGHGHDYYDSLEAHTPNLSLNRGPRPQPVSRQTPSPVPVPLTYSPLMRSRQPGRAAPGSTAAGRQNRNSYRPRVFADHIRERQPAAAPPPLPTPQRQLRSFHSDPRLAMEEHEQPPTGPRIEPRDRLGRRDGRPMSMFINNY